VTRRGVTQKPTYRLKSRARGHKQIPPKPRSTEKGPY
jgi:hypothetical protein